MKKTVSLILALLMCFTMAVTGMADYSAGTYTGTAAGRNGDITVEVILSDDAIESVTVTAHQETPGISDAALVSVPAAIVEKQSLAVDTVAGATITSAAIIDAVEAALISAGVDVEALKTAETADTVEADLVVSDETYDIIVIGGGPAGLMASVTASEKGARVLLLEKMPYVGGNMLISGGCIQAADTSVQRVYGIVTSRWRSPIPCAWAQKASRCRSAAASAVLKSPVARCSRRVVHLCILCVLISTTARPRH